LKDYLYHASSRKDLKVIKPSNITVRDPKEGKVVFATNNISYASCFIVPVDDIFDEVKQNKNNFDKILKLLCKLESENERRGEPKLLRKCV